MPWLATAGNWIANNKVVQYVLMFLGALLAFKAVQMKARMDGENAQRKKDEAATKDLVHEIQEEARTDADAAIAARDAVLGDPYPVVMSDEQRDRIFSDRPRRSGASR